ncbi:MAG: Rpn family recombination-promoting nuclease/putative transposase [Clostridia bacterium]|nr:Rpn family recombination-promoting nuclease/putative transposase [Clostridia bacterium]
MNSEKNNKLLKLTNDYVFKRIFGKKGNEDITTSFIEAVTGVRYDEINLEDTPILERDLFENKIGILDVKVIANKENDIDLEMQVVKSEYIADRILWYWSKMYSSSIERGKSYNNTKRAICILIADFNLENLKLIQDYHTKWNIREDKYTNIILTEKLEIHIIELEKLENIKTLNDTEKKLLNWCKFIKNPVEVEDSIMSENEEIKKAKEELDKISQDDKERRLAELREKALMDEIAIRDSGFKEGIEQGLKEGSQQEKISIAKNLLILKVDINSISQATGLSVEEIEKLK